MFSLRWDEPHCSAYGVGARFRKPEMKYFASAMTLARECFDFLRCAILAASSAAGSVVVHLEADGLEARLAIVSVLQTTRELWY